MYCLATHKGDFYPTNPIELVTELFGFLTSPGQALGRVSNQENF